MAEFLVARMPGVSLRLVGPVRSRDRPTTIDAAGVCPVLAARNVYTGDGDLPGAFERRQRWLTVAKARGTGARRTGTSAQALLTEAAKTATLMTVVTAKIGSSSADARGVHEAQ